MPSQLLRGSLLSIGDELLIGQVINSNSAWLSEKLTQIHCSVEKHLTVGDRESKIIEALDFLMKESKFIIIGGGLGPTHDDITLEVLSRYFSVPLEFDTDWIQQVENYFKSRNRVMSANNKKQGYLLKTAVRIDNDCGTAAGQHLSINGVDIFVVPGVPHEVKSMAERYILPALSKKSLSTDEKILQKTLLVTGIGESALAERCDSFVKKIKSISNVGLAFLPSAIQVRLRLQATVKNSEQEKEFYTLAEELKIMCGKDFFGWNETTLEELVVKKLQESNQTLAVAESCTGGLISQMITNISGSSQILKSSIIAYQPEIKTLELGVSADLIKNHGVVSEVVAKAMAEGVRKKWGADFGLATTGYLGPTGGDAFASIGTIFVAVATRGGTEIKKLNLESGSTPRVRLHNKERAAQAGIDLLRRSF